MAVSSVHFLLFFLYCVRTHGWITLPISSFVLLQLREHCGSQRCFCTEIQKAFGVEIGKFLPWFLVCLFVGCFFFLVNIRNTHIHTPSWEFKGTWNRILLTTYALLVLTHYCQFCPGQPRISLLASPPLSYIFHLIFFKFLFLLVFLYLFSFGRKF